MRTVAAMSDEESRFGNGQPVWIPAVWHTAEEGWPYGLDGVVDVGGAVVTVDPDEVVARDDVNRKTYRQE